MRGAIAVEIEFVKGAVEPTTVERSSKSQN
jgi:hypothetical protein